MALSMPSVAASALTSASDWWEDLNESALWQNRIFLTLTALFGLVSAVALVQLVRIECRVPEYGWTTQKVFHLLNFLVNGVRSVVFAFRPSLEKIRPEILQHILLDMPALAFFTTYVLLVLFWAEIYYQARAVSTDGLRPTFYWINAVVYIVQIFLWLLMWWKPIQVIVILSKIFFAGVSLFAALGFLLYGGRLFLMLQRFPVESKGRRKKLQEVGYVTTICFTCFLVRCIMMCFNAFDKAADLDVLDHPILNFLYYLCWQECLVGDLWSQGYKFNPSCWTSDSQLQQGKPLCCDGGQQALHLSPATAEFITSVEIPCFNYWTSDWTPASQCFSCPDC